MSCTPILDLLIDKDGNSMFTSMNKYAAYREVARELLDSKNINKAINILEISYQNKHVGIMLPQPMEEIPQAPMDYLDWNLVNSSGDVVGCLVGSMEWYPSVKKSNTDNNTIELELDRDNELVGITYNKLYTSVRATKVSEKDGFEYFAVKWPRSMNIKANVKILSTESYGVMELPSADYDVDTVADELSRSEDLLNFLDEVNLLESFHIADSNKEKIAIVVLAMYNSLSR